MLVRTLTLSQFRNIPLATLAFEGPRQCLVGANGQGKSNLLEAVGCVTALRSFRTPEARHLIRQGEAEAGIALGLEREGRPPEAVTIRIRADGKELWWDGARVARLADHVGRYPTVVFSAQDLQLVRGAPALRRRWLDLTLSAMDTGYLAALQAFGRALADRNTLLRRPGGADPRELSAFDKALAPPGARIVEIRAARTAEIAALLGEAHRQIAPGAEPAELRYASPLLGIGAEGLLRLLEEGRARDVQAKATQTGPHRDDLRFEVGGRDARDYASEGQQRSAMLALRLAQAAWFRAQSGVRPVLLADDVLGELDPERRRRFWDALDPDAQVIATGTEPPDPSLGSWQVFRVEAGAFSAGGAAP